MFGIDVAMRLLKRFIFGLCLMAPLAPVLAQVAPPNPFGPRGGAVVTPNAISTVPPSAVGAPSPRVISPQSNRPAAGIAAVGPGDTLQITVFGQPELSAVITVGVDGGIMVPVVGVIDVIGASPAEVAARIAQGLRNKDYLRDPQVSVEVTQVRSQMTSILGEVMRPGRYPLEGPLTLLELLAMAGGLKDTADDTAILLRRSSEADTASLAAAQTRLELYVGGRQAISRQVQNVPLIAGDVVYIGPAKRFYIYGEVARAGAYPMEDGLTVMRAISLGGGLSQRASDRRITINRKIGGSEQETVLKVGLTDPVLAGDVIHVDERFF